MPVTPNNNMMRLRLDGAGVPSFVCFQMCSPEFRSRMDAVKKATTNVAAVYAKDLFPLPVALPPLAEQQEIAARLTTLLDELERQETACARGLTQSSAQRQNILRAAFAGQLVPQDPNDEPASVLLERIRAERAAGADKTAAKKPRARRKQETVV